MENTSFSLGREEKVANIRDNLDGDFKIYKKYFFLFCLKLYKNPLFLHLLPTLAIIRAYLFLELKYQKYLYDNFLYLK